MARKPRKITHVQSFGGREYVVIEKRDFDRWMDIVVGSDDDEGHVTGAMGGGTCSDFCDSECSHNGGCRKSWGTGGNCGGLCTDGTVVI